MEPNEVPVGTCRFDMNTGTVYISDGTRWFAAGTGVVTAANKVVLNEASGNHVHMTLNPGQLTLQPYRPEEPPSEDEIAEAIESIRRAG